MTFCHRFHAGFDLGSGRRPRLPLRFIRSPLPRFIRVLLFLSLHSSGFRCRDFSYFTVSIAFPDESAGDTTPDCDDRNYGADNDQLFFGRSLALLSRCLIYRIDRRQACPPFTVPISLITIWSRVPTSGDGIAQDVLLESRMILNSKVNRLSYSTSV